MKTYGVLLCFALTFASLSIARAAVWDETSRWDRQWEDRYSEWVKNEFNEEIFTTGKYKGISTDCADAVYLARLIFAFENHLPYVILDPTGGRSKISNRMSRFDGGSEMSRFRNFMDFVIDITSTQSLPRDTYPIAINREFVRSGAVWSRVRIARRNFFSFLFGGNVQDDPGHADLVKNVSETGAIYLIGSTVPSAVRKLMSTSSLVFMPIETSTGLRQWLEPDWYEMKTDSIPGYSLEQFKIGGQDDDAYGSSRANTARTLSSWTQAVQTRLQLRAEDKHETLKRYAANLCNLVHSRVDVIIKSEKLRRSLHGNCMNAEEYDDYSTPSRDKSIMVTIEGLVKLEGSFGFSISGRIRKVRKYMDDCPLIKVDGSHELNLGDVAQSFADGKMSSNPNDSLLSRWGIENNETSPNCPTY